MEVVGPFHVATDPTHVDCFTSDRQKMQRLRELAPLFDEARRKELVHFLEEGQRTISLRDLDHFVTHMVPSRKIHSEYRSWLKCWGRRLFDPFRRFHRVYFYEDGRYFSTTVAQLNFFLFVHSHDLLQVAQQNAASIHRHRSDMKRQTSCVKKAGPVNPISVDAGSVVKF